MSGATDTPVSDFWWRLLWVSKPEWVLPYSSLAEAYMLCYMFPEIHLWCDTCQPFGGRHGSRAVSSTYLRGIGGTWSRELSCCHSQCEIRQTLYRLSYPGSARKKQFYRLQWSWAKVMFLQASVILSTGRGVSASVHHGIHPPEHTPLGADTPLGANPPHKQTPPQSRPPSQEETPQSRPPGTDPPLGPDTPWEQSPPGPDTPGSTPW